MKAPSPEELEFILESAIRAPSADNHHPVRFEVEDGITDIWHTAWPLPAAGGYKRVLALLSVGALSENFTVAASRFGLATETTLWPDENRPDLLLQMRWGAVGVAPDPLCEAIPKRHTNRRVRFRGPKLSSDEQAALEDAATAWPSARLMWLDEPALRHPAVQLMALAEGERFRNPVLHEELFSAIRFDAGWRQSCEEGLPPGALAIEPPLRPAFALLRRWSVMRLFNVIGGYRLMGLRAAGLPCRLAPHLGVIAVETTDDLACFEAGRAFARLWLAAARGELALQPLPASAIYALPGARGEGIQRAVQEHLREGWQGLLPGKQPLMLFRLGRAAPPAVAAGRMGIGHYLRER